MSIFSNGLQGLKGKFEETGEDRDYEEQDETYEDDGNISRAGALPARSIRPQEVVIMVPGSYGDARRAVEALEKGMTVMVLLSDNVNDEVASRFVDFMSGAVCMCHGDVMLVSADVLICVPDTVDLHEDRLAFVSGIPTWKGP